MARKAPRPARPRSVIGLIGATAITAALLPATPARAGAGVFSNDAALTIPVVRSLNSVHPAFPPGVVPADRYPTDVEVSGLAGSVTDVEVTLTGLTHTYPADVHVLLVGPTGRSTLLMGHCGSMVPIADENVTFDDEADAELPHQAHLGSGTVRPADPASGTRNACLGSSVTAPEPAPGPGQSYGHQLSVFDGTDPNGRWSMFVFDDFSDFDEGEIAAGWSLRLETRA